VWGENIKTREFALYIPEETKKVTGDRQAGVRKQSGVCKKNPETPQI